jgi:DNA invertase Pin-like site-specific DNA recombinase
MFKSEVLDMAKIYGYARASTKAQQENNSLEQQQKEIKAKYDSAEILSEAFKGNKKDRPIFRELISRLETGDMLVVTRLDRLAINTVEGIAIMQELFDKGIAVHVLNVGLLENTSMGRFFLTTLMAVAEMERNTIIERTQAGKAVAKQRAGFKEGRPKLYTNDKIANALSLLTVNGGSRSYTQVAEQTGISKSTIIRAQRERKQDIDQLIGARQ